MKRTVPPVPLLSFLCSMLSNKLKLCNTKNFSGSGAADVSTSALTPREARLEKTT